MYHEYTVFCTVYCRDLHSFYADPDPAVFWKTNNVLGPRNKNKKQYLHLYSIIFIREPYKYHIFLKLFQAGKRSSLRVYDIRGGSGMGWGGWDGGGRGGGMVGLGWWGEGWWGGGVVGENQQISFMPAPPQKKFSRLFRSFFSPKFSNLKKFKKWYEFLYCYIKMTQPWWYRSLSSNNKKIY